MAAAVQADSGRLDHNAEVCCSARRSAACRNECRAAPHPLRHRSCRTAPLSGSRAEKPATIESPERQARSSSRAASPAWEPASPEPTEPHRAQKQSCRLGGTSRSLGGGLPRCADVVWRYLHSAGRRRSPNRNSAGALGVQREWYGHTRGLCVMMAHLGGHNCSNSGWTDSGSSISVVAGQCRDTKLCAPYVVIYSLLLRNANPLWMGHIFHATTACGCTRWLTHLRESVADLRA